MHQNRLPGGAGRPQEVSARCGAAAAHVPSGRHARLSLRGGGGAEGAVPRAKHGGGADPGEGALAQGGGPCGPLPGRREPAADKKIVEALREHGDTVHIITKTHAAVQNVGLGAQTADHWVRRNVRNGHCSATWLVIEELTQLDTPLWADIACLSMNKKIRFLLLGDFPQLPAVLDSFAGAEVCRELKDSQLLHDLAGGWCHELSERWRFDEQIFEFLTWLRVDEAEQVSLPEALREARQRFPRRGEPDVSLVISHAKRLQINDRENRRLAPPGALVLRYEARGAVPTNAPQTMRVWPGLRLIGAGGKVQKGTFVTVEAVEGDVVRLESGQSFAEAHSALQRHHLRFGAGADPEGESLVVRCGVPALYAQASLYGLLPGHQQRAFERPVSKPGIPRFGPVWSRAASSELLSAFWSTVRSSWDLASSGTGRLFFR